MITVWNTPIAASVEQILRDLKLMLFSEGLLRDQNNTGSDVMVTCPFHKGGHERKPSCGVSLREKVTPDKTYEAGTVHCYTCGYTADLPTFIKDLFGMDNAMEGFKWLVAHYNYSTNDREEIQFNFFRGEDEGQVASMDEEEIETYHRNLMSSSKAQEYLRGRCVSRDVMEIYNLGFDPKEDVVLFPVYTRRGEVLFYKSRSLKGKRFFNAKEVDKTAAVYGLYQTLEAEIPADAEIWLVESEIDALSLVSRGYVEQFKGFILEHNTLMRLTKGTCKINYNSPQQVAALFYDIFKLKSVSRKEPRGTGDKIVQKFLSTAKKKDTKKSREFAEFLTNYSRFKEINKLLGTYVDKIPAVKEPKINAVYTTYNQYGAKTGRFSSSDTVSKINLQNIPSKEKRIRKIFKAREGYKLVGGDFSQIEPRVLAYLSGDESMINAYKEGKDLYAIMGSQVYQLPYEDCKEFYPDGTVNAEGKHRRTTMKSVLLGIMYERGAAAIGEQFNKSSEWAQGLIDNFYKSFPKINQYRLKIENMAETYGYVTTITGRKRRLPDMQLEDKDDYRYQEAHRQSLNSVIQGSSADIMKLSMIEIYRDPRYKELDCHMIITVHDELIMEVPEENVKAGADLLVGTMKRVGHSLIDLPMSVDAEVNDYWYGENLAEQYGL